MINKTLFSDQEFEQIMALLEAEDGKSYFFEAMQLMDKFFYEAGKRSYDEYEKLHADVNTTSLYGYAANNVRNYRGYREALHNLADALDNAYKAQDGLWYYRFAIALTYMGYVKDAKKFLQEALFFKDVHYLVYFLLAKLNVKSGYYKKALNLVEVALNKEPHDAELLELKELILQRANFYKILDPSLSDQEVEILNQGILPLNCSANLRQSATVLPNLENLGKILEFLEIKSAKEYSAHHSCIFYSFKIMPVRLVFDMNLNGVSKLEVRFIQGLIQKIYKEYYGKIVPLLYLLSFFQDGVSYLRLFKNNLTIEKCLDNLDRFTFVDVRIGNPSNVNESNTYLSSLYDVYQNVKNYAHVENLSDINYQYFFNYLFGPYSTLKDYEKLVITHYFEEEKRAKNVLEAFKDKQISTKLFDAVNMSNTEIGSYLNLNKRNNFIEANIYKGTFLKQIALTEMNIEANNNFIYIINHEDEETLKYKFMKIKNYPYGIISISPIGVLVEKYRK